METKQTTIELDLNVKYFNQANGEMINAVSSSLKLTKADAGKNLNDNDNNIEFEFNPVTKGSAETGLPTVIFNTNPKLTKADAG